MEFDNVTVTEVGELGSAVISKYNFAKEFVILVGWGPLSRERSKHTIQISYDGHITPNPPIKYLNHSCDPNCVVVIKEDQKRVEIHAFKNIQAGQELTIDYRTFEKRIGSMSACLCGTNACRKIITGFDDLTHAERDKYGRRYIAPYLLDS